jgi:cytidylate kinase
MAIITISRGTFSGGQSLAECIAEKLGYRCISREVLVKAAKQYGVPLEKLSKALEDAPGLLEHLTGERAHYLAYIRAVLCKEAKDDRMVYHGLVGHLLFRGLPHVLRVRVIANMEFRINGAMDRRHLSREEATQFIKKVDDKRSKWTKFLYGVDWRDPSLYDLVVNLDHINLQIGVIPHYMTSLSILTT